MFEETLAQLKVNLANSANRVPPLKEAIQAAKEKLSLSFYENADVTKIVYEYSNFIYDVLGFAWDEFRWIENDKSWRKSRISLLAVGGVGLEKTQEAQERVGPKQAVLIELEVPSLGRHRLEQRFAAP